MKEDILNTIKNLKIKIKKQIQKFLIKKIRKLTTKSYLYFQDEKEYLRRATQILHINGQGDFNRLSPLDRVRYRERLESNAEAKALCIHFLVKAQKWDEHVCKKKLTNKMVHDIIEFQSELGILRLKLKEISQEIEGEKNRK